jgi:hypothetical protein
VAGSGAIPSGREAAPGLHAACASAVTDHVTTAGTIMDPHGACKQARAQAQSVMHGSGSQQSWSGVPVVMCATPAP